MNRWKNISYQRITEASVSGKTITVHFENRDKVTVLKSGLAHENDDLLWENLTFNSFELIVPTQEGKECLIPWDKIRVISDSEFSSFLAEKAEEQAKSVGLKLKKLRKQSGILSKDLAERSGLTPQTITRIEKGKQDVNFKTLQKILAAMGYSLSDLAQVKVSQLSKTFDILIKKIQEAGIPRGLLYERLIPEIYLPQLNEIKLDNPELILDSIAQGISRVFGWQPSEIWSDKRLEVDDYAVANARFKLPQSASIDKLKAYSHYAHFLAKIVLKGTANIKKAEYPTSTEEVIKQINKEYGNIEYENILYYIWGLGIRVLPLSDTGVFHGVSWNINGNHIIILKQNVNSHARWIYDSLHETYHVFAHLGKPNTSVLEYEEISPASHSTSDYELEANAFAKQVIFDGKEEMYADMCVQEAGGKVEYLKNAVITVAKKVGIREDILANYIAYRLQQQGQNWWGTATNLQLHEPNPFEITKKILLENINFNLLDNFEKNCA